MVGVGIGYPTLITCLVKRRIKNRHVEPEPEADHKLTEPSSLQLEEKSEIFFELN